MTRRTSFLIFTILLVMGAALWADGRNSVGIESFDTLPERTGFRPTLVIESKVGDNRWTRRQADFAVKGESVKLRVSGHGYDAVRWYLIFPDLTEFYKNATPPFEPGAYQWLGYDRIRYHRIRLERFDNRTEIDPFDIPDLYAPVRAWLERQGRPPWSLDYYHGDVGTFWFQAEATRGERMFRSRGIEDADERGLTPKVMRVSVGEGEGYLRYLTSFYNVPGVFGSVLSQSIGHVGADCADILMSARAEWRRSSLKKNYNVNMLVAKFRALREVEMAGGEPDVNVDWGATIRPGDFIAVRYDPSSRKYHHIGALYSDANRNGVLDGDDLVLHAGPDPLHVSRLADGVFDGHVAILRH